MDPCELLVLYEHPEWQKPLFAALERRGVSFGALDLKRAAFVPGDPILAKRLFNQASPSAYVPASAFGRRGRSPSTIWTRSASGYSASATGDGLLLKPEQGGSGARIEKLASYDELRAHVDRDPAIWQPDGVLLLQEYCEHDHERGIVRMEMLGGELLDAMRVVSHGRYNLCPSEVCNPSDPAEGGHLESRDERVYYDVNANSNLRPAIAKEFGFDPFDRVVDYLVSRIV